MHALHVDHLGPFVKSTKGNSYLIIAIDGFTKFVFLKAVKTTKSILVENFLKEIFSTFGVPHRIVCDRGSNFTSESFTKFCETNKIKRVLNATASPRANGQCERYNRTILNSLTTSIVDERHWDKDLGDIVWAINNVSNETTGKSAYELLFGIKGRNMSDCLLTDNQESRQDLLELRKDALKRTSEKQAEMKITFDKGRMDKCFKEQDLVLVRKRKGTNDGLSRKLLPAYEGPYKITKVLPNDRYVVEDIPGAQRTQKFYTGVQSVSNLKAFKLPNEGYSSESDSTEGGDSL